MKLHEWFVQHHSGFFTKQAADIMRLRPDLLGEFYGMILGMICHISNCTTNCAKTSKIVGHF
jgi:hypothetical protein